MKMRERWFWIILLIVVSIVLYWQPWQKRVSLPMRDGKKYRVSREITIGTGDPNGLYFQLGGDIAKILNANKEELKLSATVFPSGGSVFNIRAVMAGELDFGFVQSDVQAQAVKGEGEQWHDWPQNDLRAVFALQPELVFLITSDPQIKEVKDLENRRFNIGNTGSGPRSNAILALEKAGLLFNPQQLNVFSYEYTRASEKLLSGDIDALFYTVGRHSQAITKHHVRSFCC